MYTYNICDSRILFSKNIFLESRIFFNNSKSWTKYYLRNIYFFALALREIRVVVIKSDFKLKLIDVDLLDKEHIVIKSSGIIPKLTSKFISYLAAFSFWHN